VFAHPRSSLLLLALLTCELSCPWSASAYSVLLRWRGAPAANIAGYHLHVRENGGSYGSPIDVQAEDAGALDHFEALLDDLATETTYTFALSAYTFDGRESELSNEQTIGYANAAVVVDSDDDGLTDAQEDVNLNGRRDAGETDRLAADSDGDRVPDGIEVAHGSDPLDAASPTCAALDFTTWRFGGGGTAEVVFDPEIGANVLVTTATGRTPTHFRATYTPSNGALLAAAVLATAIRDGNTFRVELRVRSTAGHRYQLVYEAKDGADRAHGRRLWVALGTQFSADAYAPFARDLAADLARLNPDAVLAGIERIRFSGGFALQPLQTCQ
jgi:hypothetical protein